MAMERKYLIPKKHWAKGLIMAAIVWGIQPGVGLAPGNGGVARARPEAAAAEMSMNSSGAPAQAPAEQPAVQAIEPARSFAGKRDPFKLPPAPREAKEEGFRGPLPPGKRGLVIGQLKLKGIVHELADQTMIAVVTNQANRAYFLRVHDEVYNGVVREITANSIRFKENRLGNNGRLESREIVLKLGSPSGEGR
jgi:hypothetical protein